MPTFETATVTEVLAERPGLQRVGTSLGRAYALTDLVGPVAVGDRVVLNTTAVGLGLGTGGWHVVHWNLARDRFDGPSGGHIMKLRYSSLQADVGAAEEAHPDVPADLRGVPVVACTLHSQVPIVAAALLAERPDARVAYVMTDGAALPMALSDLVVSMRGAGLVHTTLTAGHAFGGDLEAVSVPSALALAVHVAGADAVVVGMGPGVVGTGSGLGTTAVEAAAVLDATAALGGRPVCCVRASAADPRERHRGVSHHVTTVLDLTRSRVEVATVPGAPLARDDHEVVVVDPVGVAGLLADRGLRVTSMGRGPEDDPLFHDAAGAAGTVAGRSAARR
ncbi:MAG TPA: DUF3866 family protein [Acidimicrobiales bacterium]|nr:DUF3866 family protein [Acidimicrobiales bacterium]